MRGVHTALVTPFADGELDLPAFRVLIERQLAAGVQGLVVCGTTGETPTLSPAEWASLVQITVEMARGKAFVTAGCGTNDTRATVENIRAAKELGADAALAVLPYYNKPNNAGHIGHFQAAAAAGLPLVPYHVPGRTGQRVSVGLLARIANLDGVIAIKEATADLTYGSALIEQTDRAVLSGDDFTFFPLMCVGGAGVISVVSNVDPARTVALSDAALAGRMEEGRRLHHQLMPLVDYLFSEVNPVPCKAALSALGLCRAEVRLPLAPAAEPTPPSLLSGISR